MASQKYFSETEAAALPALYRKLRGVSPEPFEGKGYLTLRRRIEAYAHENRWTRDLFGLNPLLRAMETAIMCVTEIGVKRDSVVACLLMPFVTEETQLEDVRSDFGGSVDRILHGLLHIGSLYKKSPSVESENFRNLIVSMAEDMRVILIMIANRRVLLRRINDTRQIEERKRVAEEAAYLYAPLAHKLGLYQIKSELEDLSLKYMNHDAYYLIKEKLNQTKRARDEYIEKFIAPVRKKLEDAGFKFHIKGRTKSIHSIWQKMQKQNCQFEGVYDLFAIRIILDAPPEKEKAECWQVYSIITDMYRPNPKRLRDWLSIPKSNGYESLHITVMGPEGRWVEVQIRTERMDEIAEHGLAAHWRYKGIKAEENAADRWLADIREALEAGDDELHVMDRISRNLKADEIYVFTPKGDLHKLPAGATVLDFAYSVHSHVGDHCIGAIVNGKNASMRRRLNSGDQVSILTGANQRPKLAWQDIVVTSRAKAKIRQSVRELELKEGAMAREQLERTFRNRKIEYDQDILHQAIKHLGYKEIILFYKDLAAGRIDMEEVVDAYRHYQQRDRGELEKPEAHSAEEFVARPESEMPAGKSQDDVLVIDRNLKGLDYSLARCCNPVYGDEIFGFVTRSGGLKIHRTNCPNAPALRARFGYRIVKARWAGQPQEGHTYPIVLHIVGNDSLGVVNNISSIISKEEKINMRSFSIDTNDGLFSGTLTLMISNAQALDRLIKKLQTVKGVKNVTR